MAYDGENRVSDRSFFSSGGSRALGQFRAVVQCPLCKGDNGDRKWTCEDCTKVVVVHRELIRNLQSWMSLFEAREVDDTLRGEDGREYSLWDMQVFYQHRTVLPDRQRLTIEYCLYQNLTEKEAAIKMGIRPSNPVSIYATIGLTSLLARATVGDLSGYIFQIKESVHV